ncbi:helix-turn-helix domain-containing protein [Flavobacterium sp. MDT1-60]|uniref:helix-turn-helix domain-containing protein n=1 Tax=Flavobacterium sp. MDT1-60 TaxID=1979344 RepID=UPI001781E7DD|nr:helix-turn-helix domain-containing protein [Flavobacterium sp. MDT1-60]QOG02889.1 AraC family transcriptional regulator [Flavobacterium sp. MDT1-60]
MKIVDFIPTDQLKPFVRTYKIIESQDELVNRVLPNTSLAIAFRCKGNVNYIRENRYDNLPISTISGIRKSVRLINYSKDTATIVIQFKEAGAKAFFKEPLHELFEESVSLDNFIPQEKIAIIEELLAEAKTNNQKIAIIEQFLLSRLHDYKPDKLISAAVAIIQSKKGVVRIKELADTLYISQDAFEKRFRKTIGSSPKQFCYVVRIKSIIDQKQDNQNLIELAFDAGYFDQPHFNKDFRLFTGQTPSEFFKFPSFW